MDKNYVNIHNHRTVSKNNEMLSHSSDLLKIKELKELSHLQWVGNGVLLYTTGNYNQSLGTEHDER